jgi:hypothetical protein
MTTPKPPPLHSPPARWSWLAGAAAIVAIALLLFIFNPAEYRLYPRCMFYATTGWQCPGCGGLRAAHQLLHGNFYEAFRLNPLLFLLLPIVAWFGLRHLIRRLGGPDLPAVFDRPLWVWLFVITIILFGVLRNLPIPPFTWLQQ